MSAIVTTLSCSLCTYITISFPLLISSTRKKERKGDWETSFLVAGAKVHVKLIEVTGRTGGEKEKTL